MRLHVYPVRCWAFSLLSITFLLTMWQGSFAIWWYWKWKLQYCLECLLVSCKYFHKPLSLSLSWTEIFRTHVIVPQWCLFDWWSGVQSLLDISYVFLKSMCFIQAVDMEALSLLRWLATSRAAEDINSDYELIHEIALIRCWRRLIWIIRASLKRSVKTFFIQLMTWLTLRAWRRELLIALIRIIVLFVH